ALRALNSGHTVGHGERHTVRQGQFHLSYSRHAAVSLIDVTQSFAAYVERACLLIGHHPSRSRQNRNAQAVHDPWHRFHIGVPTQTRRTDPLQLCDRRLTRLLVVFEGNLNIALAVVAVLKLIVEDVSLVEQHFGYFPLQVRPRDVYHAMSGLYSVPQPGQIVSDRISHFYLI